MNFNETLEKMNTSIMSMYPMARFYEAQGILGETDGEIVSEVTEMTIVYALPVNKTLIARINQDIEKEGFSVSIVDSPWLEDRTMTPYVGMDLSQAIERIKQANYIMKSHNVVLRHPLHPDYTRPIYIWGDNKVGGVSVDIVTGDVKVEEVNKNSEEKN